MEQGNFQELKHSKTLVTLRRVERLSCTIAKREADAIFLQKCVLYSLIPKFIQFKFYKKTVQNLQRTKLYPKSLLLHEIKHHQTEIKIL